MTALLDFINRERELYPDHSRVFDYYSSYNVVHFQGNVDIQIVPKNACSTIKSAYMMLHYAETTQDDRWGLNERKRVSNTLREKGVLDAGSLFRTGSERLAIYRDPVKRAISAAIFILHHRYKYNWDRINPSLVNQFLDQFDYTKDIHMSRQTYWLGKDKHFFDKIYNISDTQQLLERIQSKYDSFFRDITHLWVNSSKVVIPEEDIYPSLIDKIKLYYKADYDFIESL